MQLLRYNRDVGAFLIVFERRQMVCSFGHSDATRPLVPSFRDPFLTQ